VYFFLTHRSPPFQRWSYLADPEAIDLARQKLFHSPEFNPKDVNHVFAIFAVRVGLEIGEGEDSARLAAEAVRSHMRIFLGFAGSRAITTSPSEPMLAIAAAEALNKSPEVYQDAFTTLNKLILRNDARDWRLKGGLYTRLLLTFARDRAALCGYVRFVTVNAKTDMYTVRAVQLDKFIQTLLGPELGVDVSRGLLRTQLLEDTSKAWVNFTHFVQLSQIVDEVTPTMLLEAWSSCTAFQCTSDQPVINGFIVAYRGDLDQGFDIGNLFMVPWQINPKAQAEDSVLPRRLTGPFVVETDDSGKRTRRKTEVLVIFMDLNVSSNFATTGALTDLTHETAMRPEGRKWGGYARKKEPQPKRYCLNIRGHDEKTYPVMAGLETQFGELFQQSLAHATHPKLAIFEQGMEAAMDSWQVEE
jgi:hypothetical protein